MVTRATLARLERKLSELEQASDLPEDEATIDDLLNLIKRVLPDAIATRLQQLSKEEDALRVLLRATNRLHGKRPGMGKT